MCIRDRPKRFDGTKEFAYQGLKFLSLGNRSSIKLADNIKVDESSGKVSIGSDKQLEISIPIAGLAIELSGKCTSIDVYVAVRRAATSVPLVSVTAFDEQGKQIAQETGTAIQNTSVIRVSARSGIARIELKSGNGDTVVYRICCVKGVLTDEKSQCLRFDKLRKDDPVAALSHGGLRFSDLKRKKTLTALQSGSSLPISSTTAALQFAETGLSVDFNKSVSSVSLSLIHI